MREKALFVATSSSYLPRSIYFRAVKNRKDLLLFSSFVGTFVTKYLATSHRGIKILLLMRKKFQFCNPLGNNV